MCNRPELQTVMSSLTTECKTLFGNKLCDVRLFGSYARGDFDNESDIDVMIVAELDNQEIQKYLFPLCRITSRLDLEHNVLLSPVLRSRREYDARKNIPGFYSSVEREGVSMYANGTSEVVEQASSFLKAIDTYIATRISQG